jgi:hypothetical protein
VEKPLEKWPLGIPRRREDKIMMKIGFEDGDMCRTD